MPGVHRHVLPDQVWPISRLFCGRAVDIVRPGIPRNAAHQPRRFLASVGWTCIPLLVGDRTKFIDSSVLRRRRQIAPAKRIPHIV